ncbi:MAG: hypothetical protein OEY28_06110 [Nitrospira sp.]|nr:hypothetical protein [Nitrospira sp.]
MIAFNPNREYEYILQEERGLPKDQQTVFILRGLTHGQHSEVLDCNPRIGAMASIRLRYGLVGWKNLRTEDGKQVVFTKGDAALDFLGAAAAMELEMRIAAITLGGKWLKDDEPKVPSLSAPGEEEDQAEPVAP